MGCGAASATTTAVAAPIIAVMASSLIKIDFIMATFDVLQLFAAALPQPGNTCLHGFEGRFGISENRLMTFFDVLYIHLESPL